MTERDRLFDALADLRRESEITPSSHFQQSARAAMHAVAATRRRRAFNAVAAMRLRIAIVPSIGAAAAVAASVLIIGWSAPAGSPLYAIRTAHEELQLLAPGIDRCAAELGDAESRLADASGGRDRSASLAAASLLLAAARADLPANHSSPDWPRWTRDEQQLAAFQTHDDGGKRGSGGGPCGTTPSPSDEHGASPSPGSDDGQSTPSGHGASGDDQNESSSPSATSSPGSDGGSSGGGASGGEASGGRDAPSAGRGSDGSSGGSGS